MAEKAKLTFRAIVIEARSSPQIRPNQGACYVLARHDVDSGLRRDDGANGTWCCEINTVSLWQAVAHIINCCDELS